MDRDVLIVGGGPTGMALGLQLQRYGVSFRVIERRKPGPSPSKALSINPAALHLLNDLDLADPLVAIGHKTEVANLLYNNRRLTRLRFDRLHSRYPFFLMLPQPETEAAMEARLVALGHAVERGCELVDLIEEAGRVRVRVRVRRPGGIEEETYRYVAGCDGARSTVRRSINLDFRGHDYHMHFLLADVRICWPGAREEAHYFVRDDGFLILLPLKNGYHRIVVKADGVPSPGYRPTLERIRSCIAHHRISELEVEDPIWLSSAPFYNRSAPTFRRGRVFIAGDAAHLFSPIGGFGMNTGIGDAFNLGWKLGYALRGIGTGALLASYDEERHANAQKLLARTDRSTSLIARLDRHSPDDESCFLPRMHNRAFIRRSPWDASGLALAYGGPDAPPLPDQPLERGRQLPYVADVGSGHDSLAMVGHGYHRFLLVAPRDAARLQAAVDFSRELCRVSDGTVRPLLLTAGAARALPPDLHLPDPEQRVRRAYRLGEGDFVLVRPDLYVEWVGNLAATDPFLRHLRRMYGLGRPTSSRLAV